MVRRGDINKRIFGSHPRAMQEKQLSTEQLLFEIASLRQELEQLKTEKVDLEILLDTMAEHSDSVEADLQNKAEEAVRESERRIAQFMEAMPIGVFVVDNSGRTYYANQMAESLLGKSINREIHVEQLPEVYQSYVAGTNELYDSSRQPISRALKGEISTVDDLELHQGDKVVPLEVWASPIFDERGEVVYAIAAFQDITQRKQAEAERIRFTQELKLKNTALQQMDKLKDEFLANTSHELRTPLNGIIGIAESLIDGATGELAPKTIANLAMIASSGKRLATLVNNILDFAKLKHHNLALQIKPTGMKEITDVVMALCQPLIAKKPLELINQIPTAIPLVDADENRVYQILHNLIGNGIKFTETGTIAVSAEVISEQWLAITVSDTGIGIAADKLERIFESFEQADGSTAREYGGTGLGLAIAKQLVELHGGQISARSLEGSGSQFTFTLPISQEQESAKTNQPLIPLTNAQIDDLSVLTGDRLDTSFLTLEPKLTDAYISSTLNATQEETTIEPLNQDLGFVSSEGRFKILIVDDEVVNRQVLINNLSVANYSVFEATSGLEALELLENGLEPDLVILDVMMPRMTGYEVCQRIRESFPAHELPVVLLTAKNQVSDLVEGLTAGANDYLTKPVSKTELLARIRTHIQLAKINTAYSRFVPRQFLQLLNKESIVDVKLGDQVEQEMSVMFADIRDFTKLSETMTPEDNFRFINAYLSTMEPAITENGGFIDKYIGDAIMALFSGGADEALKAGISMLELLNEYNQNRSRSNYAPIKIGIGINTGFLRLGTVGGHNRMDGTVISDAVNLASRLEGLTKNYGVPLLISHHTFSRLQNHQEYDIRIIDRVKVKGKSESVSIFEVFNADPPEVRDAKLATMQIFEEALMLYNRQRLKDAEQLFNDCLRQNPSDKVAQIYLKRCQQHGD